MPLGFILLANKDGTEVSQNIREHISRSISRKNEDKLNVIQYENKIIITICGESEDINLRDNYTIICGDICSEKKIDGISFFENISEYRGHFCGIHRIPEDNREIVFVDFLGARPVYISNSSDKFCIFSTSLRALNELHDLIGEPLEVDEQGALENLVFGYAFGTRTQYKHVLQLDGGTYCDVESNGKYKIYEYYNFNDIERDITHDAQHLLDVFKDAVNLRINKDNKVETISFLSGGLDSRFIVSSIKTISSHKIRTFTFSRRDSLDTILARKFASIAETEHESIIVSDFNLDGGLPVLLRKALRIPNEASNVVNVWSGDGGSVTLGHVYIDDVSMNLALQKNYKALAEYFCSKKQYGLPVRLFSQESRQRLKSFSEQALHEALKNFQRIEWQDRFFFLFLLLNDQRKHLLNHYENIDIHRVELTLPFFDRVFVEKVISERTEHYLFHRKYMQVLEKMPKWVLAVPYQHYKDHIPSALPLPSEAQNQWDRTLEKREKKEIKDAAKTILKAVMQQKKGFPKHLLDIWRVILICFLAFIVPSRFRYQIFFLRDLMRIYRIC